MSDGDVVDRIAEIVIDDAVEHAEGPIWDGRDDTLLWVDQYRGGIRRARRAASGALVECERFDLGMAVGAVVPAADGWLVAAGDGFHRLARDGRLSPIADVLPDDGVRRRMNDGKCDPQGRFWAGSMAYSKQRGAGALYRLEADIPQLVLDGVTISNGLAWTPDGGTMFYIDTPTRTVRRFRVSPAGLSDGEVVVSIPPEQGAPDGMCIDADGCLWVALWGGGAVQRYSADGRLLERVHVGAAQVSSCCFGDSDGSTLFITTSQEGYDERALAADPDAGKIFAVRTGTSAGPAAEYLVSSGD
ncbi:SMP-30/gluconolactonase/LRE family protein [Leifsonia poae]|uniref:Gluconolactonase n=1 Tax=Leifsonia poae TaxID=110933 RepID=A0A9W6HB96_9MICO|nr:SMP-30/gluconolactonase/LRE family protein [Leifsonia poae]GLJ77359.1 gluconolactonase [Leifsonia poae]